MSQGTESINVEEEKPDLEDQLGPGPDHLSGEANQPDRETRNQPHMKISREETENTDHNNYKELQASLTGYQVDRSATASTDPSIQSQLNDRDRDLIKKKARRPFNHTKGDGNMCHNNESGFSLDEALEEEEEEGQEREDVAGQPDQQAGPAGQARKPSQGTAERQVNVELYVL